MPATTPEKFYESSLERLRQMRVRRQALSKHAATPSLSSQFWYPLLRGFAALLFGLAALLCMFATVLENDVDRVRLLALATLFPFAGMLGTALRAPDRWLATLLIVAYLATVLGMSALSIAGGLNNAAAALTGSASGAGLLSLFCMIGAAAHYHDRQMLQRMEAVLSDDLYRIYEGRLLAALSVVKVDPATRSEQQMDEMRHNLDRLDNELKQIEAKLEQTHAVQL